VTLLALQAPPQSLNEDFLRDSDLVHRQSHQKHSLTVCVQALYMYSVSFYIRELESNTHHAGVYLQEHLETVSSRQISKQHRQLDASQVEVNGLHGCSEQLEHA
jgi:hypothetical protein